MNKATGIITKYSNNSGNGATIPIASIPIQKLELHLKPDRIWDFGIDQSSSCTGMCIQTKERDFQILLDLQRDKCIPKEVFYSELFQLAARLMRDMQVRMLIMERPAPKAMYASRVLEELRGHVMAWGYQIPELENSLVDSVFPQIWKSKIMDKSKGKNRSNVKRFIAEDIVDKFPLLKGYLSICPSSDYDSFDATGVLNGFLKYAFDDSGHEMIHGVKEKTHVSLVGYAWVDRDKESSALYALGGVDAVRLFKPKYLVYNADATLHSNVRMASSNWDFVYTVLPCSVLDQFMWKYGIDPEDQTKVMIMYVVRKGRFTNAQLEYFKENVPWNEEVFDE